MSMNTMMISMDIMTVFMDIIVFQYNISRIAEDPNVLPCNMVDESLRPVPSPAPLGEIQ